MGVHVVTDSSSCLPPDVAEAAGVTVLKLHAFEEGGEQTTAGLSSLELAAAYGRLLERGGDAGVVAIHLSKELSATWSNAVSAAGVFEGSVAVVDTDNIGMVLGFAALRAAEVAAAGGDVNAVRRAAEETLETSSLWLYVHRLDSLRKGGRITAGQTLVTTALAIKPIFRLAEGKLTLAAKTRTQAKAMDKMVDIVLEAAREVADGANVLSVAVHHSDDVETAEALREHLAEAVEGVRTGTSPAHSKGRHKAEQAEPWPDFPQVQFSVVELSDELKVHAGPGAVGVALAVAERR